METSCGFNSRSAYEGLVMKERHLLLNNSHWKFNQPELGFSSSYTAVNTLPLESKKKNIFEVAASNTCREGVVTNTRGNFQRNLTNLKELQGGSWRDNKPPLKVTAGIDLTAPEKKATELRIQWTEGFMVNWVGIPKGSEFPPELFLQVCDAVMGPVCVLLGPWRPQGDWWKTNPAKARKIRANGGHYVGWKGSDNWFLAHPATVGIATALYRQCYHLCGAGLAEEIVKTLKRSEVEEVMSSGSQKLALQLVKRTRPYIEVPIGKGASRVNYAFAMGFWRRLIRLQRAIRLRGGYEKALGQDFAEGWNLLSKSTAWTGLWRFWGDEEELTDHHRHLMKTGAPRRAARGHKPATKAS